MLEVKPEKQKIQKTKTITSKQTEPKLRIEPQRVKSFKALVLGSQATSDAELEEQVFRRHKQ